MSCWRFYARDPVAHRAWQAYYAMNDRNAPAPAQPQWVALRETLEADTMRSKVRAEALRLAGLHGCVKAEYGLNEIAVYTRYIVDKMPRGSGGSAA